MCQHVARSVKPDVLFGGDLNRRPGADGPHTPIDHRVCFGRNIDTGAVADLDITHGQHLVVGRHVVRIDRHAIDHTATRDEQVRPQQDHRIGGIHLPGRLDLHTAGPVAIRVGRQKNVRIHARCLNQRLDDDVARSCQLDRCLADQIGGDDDIQVASVERDVPSPQHGRFVERHATAD